jgi:CRP/FNR family transcriptional regulator, anaerobic regulatory protein
MFSEIENYLQSIKNICSELSETELSQFGKGLTVLELNKNDFYISAGQIQKQGGFLVKGLIRAYYTDDLGNGKNIYFIPEICIYLGVERQTLTRIRNKIASK